MFLGTERIPEDRHKRLKYLDLNHQLRGTGVEILCTVADLRLHLEMVHHQRIGSTRNLRVLARQHLIVHALMATLDMPS